MKKEEFLLLMSMVNGSIKSAYIPECAYSIFASAVSNTVSYGNTEFTFRNAEVVTWKDEDKINITVSDLDKKITIFFSIDGKGKNIPYIDIIYH